MTERSTYIGRMVDGYLECADWADAPTDENGEEVDTLGFAAQVTEQATADCGDFFDHNSADLAEIGPERAGHDFWLTRNRHGAGFWDRGLGEVGDRLTEQAHSYGEAYLYVGDDGLTYLS